MNEEQLKEEVRDLNLSYLLLAQRLIRADRAQALYRLGISETVADRIDALSTAQLLRVAATHHVMCTFRFDDEVVWDLIASHGRDATVGAGMHAAIVMAARGALAEATV